MHNDLQIKVLFANGIDVVLDIAQSASLGLGVIVVDMVNNFLFAIAITCNSDASDKCADADEQCECDFLFHCFIPLVDRLLS